MNRMRCVGSIASMLAATAITLLGALAAHSPNASRALKAAYVYDSGEQPWSGVGAAAAATSVEQPAPDRLAAVPAVGHRYDDGAQLTHASAGFGNRVLAPQSILPTPGVGSPKLQNIVDDLYKGTTNPGRIGTGTTADALRYELSTGQRVFGRSHLQKAGDSLRGLENWLKANPGAPCHDRLVARSLADDLLDALGSAP